MHCPKCTAENPNRARFCLECGASFGPRCAGCGEELAAKARFCLECGRPVNALSPASEAEPCFYTPKHLAEKILSTRSAIEGERKQVTVLFADLKGSMDLSESIDPEEWHKIMERFFQILTDGVHRFEGTVNQYTGDGIMALFGAPVELARLSGDEETRWREFSEARRLFLEIGAPLRADQVARELTR